MSMKWGDLTEQDEEDQVLNQSYETPVDENGVKTKYEYTTKDGERAKVVTKVQVKKVTRRKHRDIERRKKWAKFGECAGKPPGPEPGITMHSPDEIYIESFLIEKEEEELKDDLSAFCALYNLKKKDGSASVGRYVPPGASGRYVPPPASGGGGGSGAGSGSGSGGRYVPPRGRGEGGDDRRNDDPTIRVTNLSEDTKEGDLHDLFSPFGNVKRVFLAKDKRTGNSKGFAFVSYYRREDGQRAIDKLSGYGYDHLILHLEWAKPSNN